jgi:hypothetical protein
VERKKQASKCKEVKVGSSCPFVEQVRTWAKKYPGAAQALEEEGNLLLHLLLVLFIHTLTH